MPALSEIVAPLGVIMLLLAWALVCQPRASSSIRLIALQSTALAAVTATLGLAQGASALLALAAIMLAAKAIALPWLLWKLTTVPTSSTADTAASMIPTMLLSAALIALSWLVAAAPSGDPALVGARHEIIALSVAMLLLGLLPVVLGRPLRAQFLGLLAAENGIMLGVVQIPGPARAILLQIAALALMGTLLASLRHDERSRTP